MEKLISSEESKKVRVYIGTTLENFKICGSVNDDGLVSYDKSRNPLFETDETMWVYGLNGGYIYAQKLAKDLGHTPVIISGKVESRYEGGEYPKGKPFQTDKVWLPSDNKWQGVNRLSATRLKNEKEIARRLRLKREDPIKILQDEDEPR